VLTCELAAMIFSAASGKSMITFSSLMSSIVSSAWFKLVNDQPIVVLEKITAGRAEAEFKEKHGVWDPVSELSITSPYVHSRVESNTFTSARVDLNPMPESTLSPCQQLWIWPLFFSTHP
jgi:hypothetical protein